MKLCPKCGNSHEKPGKFCSRKCANSRVFSDATNKQRSESNKLAAANRDSISYSKAVKQGHLFQGPYCGIKMRKCGACGEEFWASKSKPQYTTCSEECFLFVKRKNRAGSKTVYNNEMYDSSWEASMAKWFDENKIKFIRPKKSITWYDSIGKQRRYFPDFYLPTLDLYVDPKNKFCIQDQKEKLDKVSESIDLIYGELDYLKEIVIKRI
jgi:predicted nucleic acid-binding Zn ribbon protein